MIIRALPRLLLATTLWLGTSSCTGTPTAPSAPPGDETPRPVVSQDPADWPGPLEAEVVLRFGAEGNATATDATPLPEGDGIALSLATPPGPAATMLTLPEGADMALGPDQYLAFEIRIRAADDAPLLIRLDEPRGATHLRGLIVLEAPPRDSWQRMTVNLLRNELSGDRRAGSRIMPDGTPLTRIGFVVDPRGNAGLQSVALRNFHLYRQDPLAHAPVTAADPAGQTALHRAAMVGDAARARALLARGADVDARNAYLYTPLAHAVIAHSPATVAVLLENGADVAAQRRLGFTPLYDAAADGQLEIVRLLLDAGADPTQQTEYRFEPLFTAIHHGHLEAAELLIADPRVDVNRPIAGFLPLHVAAQGDDAGPHLALYRRLIELGAEVDLCSAAAAGDDARVRAILARDPDAAKTTAILDGWTPLHDAVRNARRSTVELLLENGADPNAVSGDIDFRSVPLHWIGNASELDAPEDKLAILRALVDAGADLDVTDKAGGTPLDRARQAGDRSLAEALRARGARTGAELRAATDAGDSDR